MRPEPTNDTRNITGSHDHLDTILGTLDLMLEAAPESEEPIMEAAPASRNVGAATGLPKRYRGEWERPQDAPWLETFARVMSILSGGGIVALIGQRGTGKTRLAAETMRNAASRDGVYTTAMELFLRLRASYRKDSAESEYDIARELVKCPLLILDEIQERGNSAWEDRVLTHIVDKRYAGLLPTVLIANLTAAQLAEQLGASILSRMQECGGIIEITGKSHRQKP